jgi:hypothetical protein
MIILFQEGRDGVQRPVDPHRQARLVTQHLSDRLVAA